jgi:hypothetical protein
VAARGSDAATEKLTKTPAAEVGTEVRTGPAEHNHVTVG